MATTPDDLDRVGHEFGNVWECDICQKLEGFCSNETTGKPQYVAGNKVFDENIIPIDELSWLPPFVVPMFADFFPATASAFAAQWRRAVESVKHVDFQAKQQCRYIIVPIRSNGGIIDTLKAMLAAMRAELDSLDIHMITVAWGPVCSCGFVLYQTGQLRLIGDRGIQLCHLASVTQQGAVQMNAEAARRIATELANTSKELYTMAERNLLVSWTARTEFAKQDKTWRELYDACEKRLHAEPAYLKELRIAWYKHHPGVLAAMEASVLGTRTMEAPDPDMNILDYITHADTSGIPIPAEWCVKLGLSDGLVTQMNIVATHTVSLKHDPVPAVAHAAARLSVNK